MATHILQSLVPISQFNKGQAAKIFDRFHSEKKLVVLKNNQPSAIIKTSTFDSVMKELGIKKSELLNMEDVDIEW